MDQELKDESTIEPTQEQFSESAQPAKKNKSKEKESSSTAKRRCISTACIACTLRIIVDPNHTDGG